VVGINTDQKTGLFSGYYVAIEPVGTVLGKNLKSADEAKALAQQDHDRQCHVRSAIATSATSPPPKPLADAAS
jgi:hypothetical protein